MPEYYSNISMVVLPFFRLFKEQIEGLTVVYDPEIAFTEGVRRSRAMKLVNSELRKKDIPMLVWNRQSIKIDEDRGEHSGRRHVRKLSADIQHQYDLIASISGSVDVEFVFVATQMRDIEYYEVLLTALMHNTLRYDCDFGELGTRGVQIFWDYPSTLNVTLQESFYIGLSATARLLTEFFIFDRRHPRLYEIWHNVHSSIYNRGEPETIVIQNIGEQT